MHDDRPPAEPAGACARDVLRNGSRSFDAAARLLPRAVREPATALYAFCRQADDAIDHGTGSLEWLRSRLDLIYQGRPMPIAADVGFAEVVSRFDIPRAVPEALLEGFAWDAEGRRYDTLSDVRAYAVRVAGTVGVMMALLMGVRDRVRLAAAIDLGIAMQFSNIARDVGEDARNGRLYLPLDWLRQAGIDVDAFLTAPAPSAALAGVVQRLLDRADQHYHRATAGIAGLPWSCRLGIGAARLLYAEIGAEVARRGYDSVSGRAVVSGGRKVRVLVSELPVLLLAADRSRTQTVPAQRLRHAAGPTEAGASDLQGWQPRGYEGPRWAAPAGLSVAGTAGCVAEAVFLLQAIMPAPQTLPGTPWWALPNRLVQMLDLFDRIERRQWHRARS